MFLWTYMRKTQLTMIYRPNYKCLSFQYIMVGFGALSQNETNPIIVHCVNQDYEVFEFYFFAHGRTFCNKLLWFILFCYVKEFPNLPQHHFHAITILPFGSGHLKLTLNVSKIWFHLSSCTALQETLIWTLQNGLMIWTKSSKEIKLATEWAAPKFFNSS